MSVLYIIALSINLHDHVVVTSITNNTFIFISNAGFLVKFSLFLYFVHIGRKKLIVGQ